MAYYWHFYWCNEEIEVALKERRWRDIQPSDTATSHCHLPGSHWRTSQSRHKNKSEKNFIMFEASLQFCVGPRS